MNRPLVLRRAARREFDEATDWYEERYTGLGARFVEAIQQVFEAASANPERYPRVFDETREGLVHGFPNCVYYHEEGDHLVVTAVFHTASPQEIWQSRA